MTITTNTRALIDNANATLDDLNDLIGELQEQFPPTWCAVFLDGEGLGSFVTPAALPGYPGTHGSHDTRNDDVVAVWQGEYYWGVMRWQPSPAVSVKRIKLDFAHGNR